MLNNTFKFLLEKEVLINKGRPSLMTSLYPEVSSDWFSTNLNEPLTSNRHRYTRIEGCFKTPSVSTRKVKKISFLQEIFACGSPFLKPFIHGCFHYAKPSGHFSWKSNGTVRLDWKFSREKKSRTQSPQAFWSAGGRLLVLPQN